MGYTVAQKILAAHAPGRDVTPGAYVMARVDMVVLSEGLSLVLDEFRSIGTTRVFDPDRLIVSPCQTTPNKDLNAAFHSLRTKNFVREQNIANYFEMGRGGIMHVVAAENGFALPGELLVGSDSHTCTNGALGGFCVSLGLGFAPTLATGTTWFKVPESSRVRLTGRFQPWVGAKDVMLHLLASHGTDGFLYQSIEFGGEAVAQMGMSERFVLCNMAVEAGAKTGVIPADETTLAYLEGRAKRTFDPVHPDPDARYVKDVEIDVSALVPFVSLPGNPARGVPVSDVGDVEIDQVFIGSCSNGRIEDLRICASVMKGHRVHPRVRVILMPGSHAVYLQAAREGLLETFAEAGVTVGHAGCGPCAGFSMGVLGEGERAISTANRNFKGRMGPPSSEVYLANPAVAAASAIAGRIASPQELMEVTA